MFDCYSPEPPLVAEEQSRLDVFHEYQVGGETDYEQDWGKWQVYPGNPLLVYKDMVSERVRHAVLEKLRGTIQDKVSRGQCVLNISDVAVLVKPSDVKVMLNTRERPARLQHVVVVTPSDTALSRGQGNESVQEGQLQMALNSLTSYKPDIHLRSPLPRGGNV